MMKSLLAFISGSSEQFSLEHQLYNTSTFIATIYILIGAFESHLIGLSPATTKMVFSFSLVISYFYYTSRVKRQYTKVIIPTIVFAFIIAIILWFTNAGISGTTGMIILISIALISVFVSGTVKKYTLIAYIALIHILLAVQYFFPESVTPYADVNTMIYDKYFTIIASSVILFSLVSFFHSRYTEERIKVQDVNSILNEKISELQKTNLKLQSAIQEVDTLTGLLPICSSCKCIRDDNGYWRQIETYIQDHSDADFTHGICPSCAEKLYPGIDLNDNEDV